MDWLPLLLGWAVLLPLISFATIFVLGPKLGEHGRNAGLLAVLAIFGAFCLSVTSLAIWLSHHTPHATAHAVHHESAGDSTSSSGTQRQADSPAEPDADDHAFRRDSVAVMLVAETHDESDSGLVKPAEHAATAPPAISGNWYTLAEFGKLRLTIGYYIDALTVAMFCMVTLIATCIHVYATGYMHDELHDVTDHEVHLANGKHLHRSGRFPRFFQALSLFCFSMLGLVISGNIAMTFVFWELVGICSYFLIGFYVERQSASTAANKAFIVNRIGDFGMIIGLMALWGSLGTFAFGDSEAGPGLFSLVRPADHHHALTVPEGMAKMAVLGGKATSKHGGMEETPASLPTIRSVVHDPVASGGLVATPGYGLLVLAGLGIFCGCVGKSAQFPLHVWLPDAMEGPTPVSALVHSATMVAAGVFLVARFYPVFTPEVLLTIACVGTITLFLAATIALTATDIKRVLAYSTVSQLGYMMMSLGVGGWLAGVLHLFTHAFFKSLLFLGSGSVIHAVHTNEMPAMGGLARKMPWTAYTMLVGCLAIAGAGIPFVIGLSGYYSKDSILEQAYLFAATNRGWGQLFFYAGASGAAMTAFYMFRLWFLTFAGEPRDHHRFDHAHESPVEMVAPLVVLATFAVVVAWEPRVAVWGAIITALTLFGIHAALGYDASRRGKNWSANWLKVPLVICAVVFALAIIWERSPWNSATLSNLLEQARPAGTLDIGSGPWTAMRWPNEHDSHAPAIAVPVTLIAFSTAAAGIFAAAVFYLWRWLSADEVRRQFSAIYTFLLNKWWFDELYDALFVKPTHLISQLASGFDRRWIDGLIDGLARCVRGFAEVWELVADRTIVDGFVNQFARTTHALGLSLRSIQTGSLRQYVMFIVIGTVAAFVIVSFFWGYALAG